MHLRKKIAALWLRQALRKQWFTDLQSKMQNKDLAFNKIFQNKKRIVVPMPHLQTSLEDDDKGDIKETLIELGALEKGDHVEWGSGEIRTSDGKKKKLGKAISRVQRKLEKGNPKLWKAIKRDLRVEHAHHKAVVNYDEYVVDPLEDLLEEWADTEVMSYNEPLRRLYEFTQSVSGQDQKKDHWSSLQTQTLQKDLSKISKISGKAQRLWAEAMQSILLFSDKDMEKARVQEQENADEWAGFKDNLREKAQQRQIGDLTPEDRQTLKNESLENRKKNSQFMIRTHEYTNGIAMMESFPKELRERLSHAVARSIKNLSETQDEKDESYVDLTKLREPLSASEKRHAALLQNLERSRQRYDRWKAENAFSKSLVISRAPLDVLRMSDHPTAPQAIQSCHSQGGSYFQCAVTEAQGTGLVGYVVADKDLEGLDLEKDEIFKDIDRNVEGITPRARIRIRRFEHNTDETELALPELATYGTNYENLVGLTTDWARAVQKEEFEKKPRMSEFTLTGGHYRDNDDSVLFNNFFDIDDEHGDTEHRREQKKPKPEEQQRLLKDRETQKKTPESGEDASQFWQWMNKTYPEVQNPNPEGRQQRITPATLKGYAEDGQYQQKAQQMVEQYMNSYRQQQTQRVAVEYLRRAITASSAEFSPEFYRQIGIQRFRHPDTDNHVLFYSLPKKERQRIHDQLTAKKPAHTTQLSREDMGRLKQEMTRDDREQNEAEAKARRSDRREMAKALKELKSKSLPQRLFDKEKRRLLQEIKSRALIREQERKKQQADAA